MSLPATPGGPDDRPDGSAFLSSLVRTVPDFPKPGIAFADLTPLFADPRGLAAATDALAAFAPGDVDIVAAVEARGFIIGSPLALRLGAGFVPVRKVGKLPARTVRADYALEYGQASIEVHADAAWPGAKVFLVDDVLATGGTAAAAAGLLERLGAQVVGIGFLAELTALNGRSVLAGRAVEAVLSC